MAMELIPIGVVHSPYKQATGTPVQPATAGHETKGRIEVFEPYVEGLKDIDGFERIWLLFWCHLASKYKLITSTYLDPETPHGVFSCRAPSRPNPIGMSCVRLLKVEGNILEVAEFDLLDGTPMLDIKPYSPHFDHFEVQKSGWLDEVWSQEESSRAVADDRFHR